jgi:hypothetical protein
MYAHDTPTNIDTATSELGNSGDTTDTTSCDVIVPAVRSLTPDDVRAALRQHRRAVAAAETCTIDVIETTHVYKVGTRRRGYSGMLL